MVKEESMSLTRGIASDEWPCTKRTCLVFSPIWLLNSLSFPAPKMIRLAVANSKENIVDTFKELRPF
jgi:hypothetical protein